MACHGIQATTRSVFNLENATTNRAQRALRVQKIIANRCEKAPKPNRKSKNSDESDDWITLPRKVGQQIHITEDPQTMTPRVLWSPPQATVLVVLRMQKFRNAEPFSLLPPLAKSAKFFHLQVGLRLLDRNRQMTESSEK